MGFFCVLNPLKNGFLLVVKSFPNQFLSNSNFICIPLSSPTQQGQTPTPKRLSYKEQRPKELVFNLKLTTSRIYIGGQEGGAKQAGLGHSAFSLTMPEKSPFQRTIPLHQKSNRMYLRITGSNLRELQH